MFQYELLSMLTPAQKERYHYDRRCAVFRCGAQTVIAAAAIALPVALVMASVRKAPHSDDDDDYYNDDDDDLETYNARVKVLELKWLLSVQSPPVRKPMLSTTLPRRASRSVVDFHTGPPGRRATPPPCACSPPSRASWPLVLLS